jgi:serine/threonine-protein kinase
MHLELATVREAVGGSRYRVLGRLGSGGMADVDLALQNGVAGTSRLCVLKRVRRDLSDRPEFMAMFFEEARISASLNHPNIVQVYEVGGDERDCFLALELLRGRSFAHVQRPDGGDREDYRVVLEVLIGALSGLEHAHQRRDLSGQPMQLVHRDVSPPNLFVTYDGEIKVLDFGVAKSKQSIVHTQAGVLKGKVAYMAPELVAGELVDARADLYAVGVMLWEATAGRERWPDQNEMAILAALAAQEHPEPPGAAARGLPALADDICTRALARRPIDRYQTAAELRSDLVRLSEELGGRLRQEELQRYMAERFTRQREREEREIEQALATGRPSFDAGASEQDGFAGTKRVARRSAKPAADVPNGAENQLETALGAAPRGKRATLVLGALALLGAGVVLALKLAPAEAPRTDAALAEPAQRQAASLVLPTPSVAAKPALVVPTPSPSAMPSAVPSSSPRKAVGAVAKPKAKSTTTTSKQLELDRQDPWK